VNILTLLVVCARNICRSPMAEALFRHGIKTRPALGRLTVESAGTIACAGHPASPDAADVIREEYGLDITEQRARPLNHSVRADLVLTVDRTTTEQALALGTSGAVEILGDFAGTGEEVDDPYGGPRHGYRLSVCQLDRLVARALDRLETEASGRLRKT
jgi:protein-tyrosine-phosphatase